MAIKDYQGLFRAIRPVKGCSVLFRIIKKYSGLCLCDAWRHFRRRDRAAPCFRDLLTRISGEGCAQAGEASREGLPHEGLLWGTTGGLRGTPGTLNFFIQILTQIIAKPSAIPLRS